MDTQDFKLLIKTRIGNAREYGYNLRYIFKGIKPGTPAFKLAKSLVKDSA